MTARAASGKAQKDTSRDDALTTSGCLQALALPMFYNQKHMGCEIPMQGFKGHSAPTLDDTVGPLHARAGGHMGTWPGLRLESGASFPHGTIASYVQ